MEKNPKRILVVEDEEIWRDKLKIILENEGYSVQVLASYGDARVELRRGQFQLAVIDLKLPSKVEEFSGMALLDHAFNKGIPTIVVTGFGTRELADEAIDKHNAFNFIDKDTFDSVRFIELVKEAIKFGVPSKKESIQELKKDKILRWLLDRIISLLDEIIAFIATSILYKIGVIKGIIGSNPLTWFRSFSSLLYIFISVIVILLGYVAWQRRHK